MGGIPPLRGVSGPRNFRSSGNLSFHDFISASSSCSFSSVAFFRPEGLHIVNVSHHSTQPQTKKIIMHEPIDSLENPTKYEAQA
jgi:hypothetical protein